MFTVIQKIKVFSVVSAFFLAAAMVSQPVAQAFWVNDAGKTFQCSRVYNGVTVAGVSGETKDTVDLAVLDDGSVRVLQPGWKQVNAPEAKMSQKEYPSSEEIWRGNIGM